MKISKKIMTAAVFSIGLVGTLASTSSLSDSSIKLVWKKINNSSGATLKFLNKTSGISTKIGNLDSKIATWKTKDSEDVNIQDEANQQPIYAVFYNPNVAKYNCEDPSKLRVEIMDLRTGVDYFWCAPSDGIVLTVTSPKGYPTIRGATPWR